MNLNNLSAIVLAGGDGSRVQSFLSALCGGTGVKQFCTIIGDRSMLQQTIDRARTLVSRERILVSLNSRHRREAGAQLADLPEENLIFQPVNLDTTAGILLPLAHVSHRDPDSVVTVFPSDHFIRDEKSFIDSVTKAVREVEKHPDALVLLGVLLKARMKVMAGSRRAAFRALKNHWKYALFGKNPMPNTRAG